jgi:hypothetical protein
MGDPAGATSDAPLAYTVHRPDGTVAAFAVGAPYPTTSRAHEAASAALERAPDGSVLRRGDVVLAIRAGAGTAAVVAHARAGSRHGRRPPVDLPAGWCTLDVAAERGRATRWTLQAALKHARAAVRPHPTPDGAFCRIVRDADIAPALAAYAAVTRAREAKRRG